MPTVRSLPLAVALGCLLAAPTYSAVVADFVGSQSKLYFSNHDGLIMQYDRSTEGVNAFNDGGNFSLASSYRELAFDNDNNLYAANFGSGSAGIVKFSQDASAISNFLPKSDGESYWGLTYGADGFLYSTLSSSNLIRKIGTDGVIASDFSDSRLDGPRGLAFDTKGNLLVANQNSRDLLIYDPAFNFVGEVSLSSQVWGVAVRPDGLVYVASGNQGDFINVYNADYQFIKSITHADLTEPAQLAFDETSSLYSSSTNLPKVVVFDSLDGYSNSFGIAFGPTLGMAFDRNTSAPFIPPDYVPEPAALLLALPCLVGVGAVRKVHRRR